jgi:hypothetical protein
VNVVRHALERSACLSPDKPAILFAVLRAGEFVAELPKSASGTILKRVLGERAPGGLAEPA